MKRTEDEIQRAHDLIIGVLNNEIKIDLNENDKTAMAASCDVLCWMLGCEHNKNFERNVQVLIQEAGNNGYFISKKGSEESN